MVERRPGRPSHNVTRRSEDSGGSVFIGTFEREERLRRRGGRETACGSEIGFQIAGVAPGKGFEAEVENAIKFVEGDAHFEALFYCGQARAAGFLHDGKGVG